MKKTPTIFKRNPDNMKEVLNEPNELCDWVFKGEGIATRKMDGTCCLVKGGKLFRRREIKKGKPQPKEFVFEDADPVTGKVVGWIPVDENNPSDRWHVEAFRRPSYTASGMYLDGTYELLGEKIQGNPEEVQGHVLMPHSHCQPYPSAPRDYEGLKLFLSDKDIEGLVFHHPDGRMAKIKKRDFGLPRKVEEKKHESIL